MRRSVISLLAVFVLAAALPSVAIAENELEKGVRHDNRELDKGVKHDASEVDKGARHADDERHKADKHVDKEVKKDL